jgi:uncharacterized membrane protein YbaN (DUF454 family)
VTRTDVLVGLAYIGMFCPVLVTVFILIAIHAFKSVFLRAYSDKFDAV